MIKRLIAIAESSPIVIDESSSDVAIAAKTAMKTIKSWSPSEIEKALDDAEARFQVGRRELEAEFETLLKAK